MSRRGQASLEYLVLIGVLLVIVALLSGYAFFMYRESLDLNQFQSSMRNLKDGINNVYYLGNGNSLVVEVTIPSNVGGITFQNNTILASINSFGSQSTDTIVLDTNVTGEIPIVVGTYDVLVRNINGDINVSVI